jgi:hypothetical protein
MTVRRLLAALVTLAIVLGPLTSALHAADQVVRPAPLQYEAHDDDAHHFHHPAGGHEQCVFCCYHKSGGAVAAVALDALLWLEAGTCYLAIVSQVAAADHSGLPSTRAPPRAS